MFDRFRDSAKKVMGFAYQEALKLNHEYIGTEHILLGLVREGGGVAAAVLKDMKVDHEQIRLEVEKLVRTGPSMVTMSRLPFTPHGQKVLVLSLEEASRLSHDYIDTEHLLLGLLGEKDGIAAQVLMNLGVELDEARVKVIEFFGATDPPVFDRFTDGANRVMAFARVEARRFHHEYLGTFHLLLGLVQEGGGVAANALKNMTAAEKIRHEVARLFEKGPSTVALEQVSLTPGARKVLELAREEATQLRHDYMGTEHLLLGLIRENECTAARVLMSLGVALEELREEVLESLERDHRLPRS